MSSFVSIDQNSHPLWDTVPKLHALTAKGLHGTHFLEDIDVAFTRRGAKAEDEELSVRPERYYRGGTSDWGATLFYTEFLGRNPLDVRDIEIYLGQTTKAAAKQLDTTVDGLYDRYSVSDNWQMVGPSYVGSDLQKHRVIGDLTVSETAPHLRRVLDIAEQDMEDSFPEDQPRQRLRAWFSQERARLAEIIEGRPGETSLVDAYRSWMSAHVTEVDYGLTSEHFSLAHSRNTEGPLLFAFLNDYETAGNLYNQAIDETAVGLNKLSMRRGELPFFLVWRNAESLHRTAVSLHDRQITAGDFSWSLVNSNGGLRLPVADMQKQGVCAIAGKALLLVLQARLGRAGRPLALPYRGSSYMPAAYALERKFTDAGLLTDTPDPVLRVKINFLESLHGCETIVRLPEHLADAFGTVEIKASTFAEKLGDVAEKAETDLLLARSDAGRAKLMQRISPALGREISELEKRQREVASNPDTRHLASGIWDEIKQLTKRRLEQFIDFIVSRIHVADLDYFNSRGAILPWSIAIGGRTHYQRLIANAEVYRE